MPTGFAELLGYEPQELPGLSQSDIIHPDEVPSARAQALDLAARKTDRYRAERRYLRKNGEPIWVLASAAALIDEETGTPSHLTVQVIDIDRLKRVEAELVATERRWNSALEAAGQGVWEVDLRSGKVFHSRMWRLIRGFGPDEEVDGTSQDWRSRLHPDDRERIWRSSPARIPVRFPILPSSIASATATVITSGSSVAAARSNGSPTGGRHGSSGPTPTLPA